MIGVEHGRGYIIVEDVPISDGLTKKLSERATHIYRNKKGNIINHITCVQQEQRD